MQLSPIERQRRSEQAKRQHAEGRLGSKAVAKKAAARSAEVRADRASSIARRLLEAHAAEVERTLLEILRHGTRSEKLKALDIAVKAGLRGEGAQLNHEKVHGEQKSRDELIAAIVAKFQAPTPAAALTRSALAEQGMVIDGQAVEIR